MYEKILERGKDKLKLLLKQKGSTVKRLLPLCNYDFFYTSLLSFGKTTVGLKVFASSKSIKA